MRRPVIVLLGKALVFLCGPALASGQSQAPKVPVAVGRWLNHQSCRIHQPVKGPLDDRRPGAAAVAGHFLGARQPDWPVLCVTRDTAWLLVFAGGRTERVDTLEVARPPVAPIRRIYTGPPAEVRMYASSLPSADVTPADTIWMRHDGIVDAVDCCGVVWYWHEGRWRQLPGPD